MTKKIVYAYPDDSLQIALEKMVMRDIGHLPVLDPENPSRLVGMLDRECVFERYKSVLSEEVSEETLRERLLE